MPDREPDLEVVVYGKAASKGSAVSFPARRGDGSIVMKDGRPVMIHKGDDDRAGAWATSISQTVAERMLETGMEMVPAKVPVVVEMVFVRPRSKSHFGTGRNADQLKDSAPAAPAVRPDVDKQTRLVLDALKEVAWHDDGQVVGALVWKEFGAPARLELRLWRLPETVSGVERETAEPQPALFVGADDVTSGNVCGDEPVTETETTGASAVHA